MWTLIAAKSDLWIERWGRVVFSPRTFFDPLRTGDGLTGGEFYLGSQLLSFLLGLASSIAFFATFFRGNLTATFGQNASSSLTISTIAFGLFIGLSFIALMVSAAVSFGVARALKSRAAFSAHVQAYLDLSALDPLAALSIVLLVLFAGAKLAVPWVPAVAMFLLARVWNLVGGFWAIQAVHAGSAGRKRAMYLLGYILGAFLYNATVVAIAWLLVELLILGYD